MTAHRDPIEIVAIRHPVGSDGTFRYRFTFEVSIDAHIEPDAPRLGQEFMEAMLRSLNSAINQHGASSSVSEEAPPERRFATLTDPNIEPACSAELVECDNCKRGFRRINGVHIGSQSLGMIPNTPCRRVFVVDGGNMTDNNTRRWMAYVDGDTIRKSNGVPRRFGSAIAAYRAARRAAPEMWHP